jgi:hypothetical protein
MVALASKGEKSSEGKWGAGRRKWKMRGTNLMRGISHLPRQWPSSSGLDNSDGRFLLRANFRSYRIASDVINGRLRLVKSTNPELDIVRTGENFFGLHYGTS